MESLNFVDKNMLGLEVERSDFFVLLDRCRKNKEFTDVQLKIGNELFDAHRVVLAQYSPVLKALISDHWSTAKICPLGEDFLDSEMMENLLGFFYTGKIKLTSDNVQPICMAAHYLQISTLLKPSVQYLCKLVTVENALPLFQFAIAYQFETLRHSCLRVIPKDNGVVLQKPEIVDFSNEIFKSLIAGLKEQCWTTKLRENTFDCIVRWTGENLSERLDGLPVLLKDIPLKQLSLNFLTETVSIHSLVKDSTSCMETVSAALAIYQPAPSAGLRRGQNLIAYGFDPETKRSCFNCYDPQTDVWTKLPEMLEPRFDFVATVVNERDIVVCGGYDEYPTVYVNTTLQLNSVEMFDWSLKTWKKLPKMPMRLTFLSVATLNSHLYIFGSRPEDPWTAYFKTVLCYSFEKKRWKNVKQMNASSCRLIGFNSYLYAFGGQTSIVEKYDPEADEWTSITSSEASERVIRAAVHNDKIYACDFSKYRNPGRHYNFKMFDPETRVWTSFPEALPPSSFVSLNGRLLAVVSHREHDKWIYEFDFDTENWKQFIEMDTELKNPKLIAGVFENPIL